MAAKLTTFFVSRSVSGILNCRQSNERFPLPSYRRLPPTCKMRHRNLSAHHRRQQVKKVSQEQPNLDGDLQTNENEISEPKKVLTNVHLNQNKDLQTSENRISEPEKLLMCVDLSESEDLRTNENEIYEPKKELTSVDSNESQDPQTNGNEISDPKMFAMTVKSNENEDFQTNGKESFDPNKVEMDGDLQKEIISNDNTDNILTLNYNSAEDLSSSFQSDETTALVKSIDGAEPHLGVQLEDLLSMIKNAEKNILLLNQDRIRALEDLDKILAEKEVLQGEINALEVRLAETDARIKAAAQEKINVELLEDQLEKLQSDLTQKGVSERMELKLNDVKNGPLINESISSHISSIHFLNKEINLLREENAYLKNDVCSLKTELTDVKNRDQRLAALEEDRFLLEAALKDLESKFLHSQEEVSKLSKLKVEYKDLWDKVENLQTLLDKANEQADQAITLLQQNQDLREKIDRLEESLEEANVYKESSEKMKQYNELMQWKIKMIEERLTRSDEEINSFLNLYQESVKDFQDTLNALKEESKRRALEEPVDDMPWEFWSHLFLMIDGWFLEKKISLDNAKTLREMVWKRDRRICSAYMASKEKSKSEVVATFLGLVSSPTRSGLHVIHIAAEMAPVAKVGGLGDVVTGLSKALQKKGHLVEVVLPKYDCMNYDLISNLRVLDAVIESYFNGHLYKNKIWVGTIEGLPVYFIEPHHPDKFFWRGKFYGEQDDFRRYSFFSRAALEFLLQAGKKPDIIHCHDWQTAFVAPLYWDLYAPKGLNSARICFTCHNFEYQGTTSASELASCGLDVQQLNRPDRMQDNSAHDKVNPVKGAVVFSNIVTTVSPTYAQEVLTAEGGKGLHSTLNLHSKKFIGILNGIDTDAWNPATDTLLKVQYSANDVQGKAENKEAMRKNLGLSSADARRPLVGCITRLVPQKGVHLIRHAIYRTLELGGQFVLLGSSPIPHIQREFEGIASHFQNHDHTRLILKYDESLSHSIYAGSDMLIIPSIFEPCGLTQMISMRYGTIPIVRKTGGLNDSVFDLDDDTVPIQFRNGFSFFTPDEQGVNNALDRAFSLYNNNPESWLQLVQKVMSIDFSWDCSAAQYEELYFKSVARARTVNQA